MSKNSALLFYNLFPRNCWKRVTRSILGTVPHDDIVVHISLPVIDILRLPLIVAWFKKNFPKIKRVLWSFNNRKRGESIGFELFRKKYDSSSYSILTYAHSKGTSRKRKDTQPIRDWTEMMRYFVVERLDLAQMAFAEGYLFAGVNLNAQFRVPESSPELYESCKFIYDGNFVTINLTQLRQQYLESPCPPTYYGLERFWGMLGGFENLYGSQ